MIVQRFLTWASTAPAGQRAEATSALARAYLYSDLADEPKRAAEAALTLMLDDVSPLVRGALAMAMRASADAPRHIVIALVGDAPEIAATVAEFSPVLIEAELVALLPEADSRVHEAIARRVIVGSVLAARLVEEAGGAAVAELLRNPGVSLPMRALERVVERHGTEPAVREILLARDDLPAVLRQTLVAALGSTLSDLAQERSWLGGPRAERVAREACERETAHIAAEAPRNETQALAAHLRRTGQLTPGLLVRVALAGGAGFVAAALAELAGMPLRRAERLIADRSACGFEALAERAGLPEPVARMLALTAQVQPARGEGDHRVSVMEAVLERLRREGDLDGSLAFLRRLSAEMRREEARALASGLKVAA